MAFTYLVDGEVEGPRCTYRRLDAGAWSLAGRLRRLGAEPGDRALLLYSPGIDFVTAFFGCLYAGVVAVPTYPPRVDRRGLDPRLASVAGDARPDWVLAGSTLFERRKSLSEAVPELAVARWVNTEESSAGAGPWDGPGSELSAHSLAFLQYTSGSTSQPKGVAVSHGNLLHNQEMIRQAFGQSSESVIVGWLPLYHDMGLIGNVLQPIYVGARCILMSPMAFLQRPARWLEAISRYRATTSGGPDFAYELCRRRIGPGDRKRLDLSAWSVAFNGAEPVRAGTLEGFARTFGPCGFDRRAFYPCYGLAEATLFVTGGLRGDGPVSGSFEAAALEENRVVARLPGEAGSRTLVACGRPWSGQQVVVADPETGIECPAGRVGEIRIAGSSVAAGYFRRPEETARDFGARLAGRGETPFLRTGDLGFFHGGELFVTGRLKDLIILRGRNHYPQDVEAAAERSHADLAPGGGAAFAVEGADGERLVVVHEVERRRQRDVDVEAVADAVRRSVSEVHEARVSEVVLIRAASLPRTTSGKVRRHACRAAYLAGELAVVGTSASAESLAPPPPEPRLTREELLALAPEQRRESLLAYLRGHAARALRIEPSRLDGSRALSALGLDSLTAVELRHGLEEALGTAPSLARILAGASLEELTVDLLAELAGGAPAAAAEPPADLAADHPLSYGQRALWFLGELTPETTAFILVGAARLGGELDAEALRRALAKVVARHPALRTTVRPVAGEPRQRVREKMAVELVEEDAADLSEGELRARLEELAYRPFDLASGPLLRMGLLRRGDGGGVIFLAVHHLVSDLWSLSLLLSELEALYEQETGGEPAELAPVSRSYVDYVYAQQRLLTSERGEALWNYWRRQLAGELPVLDLPLDRPRPMVQSVRGAYVGHRVEPRLTAAVETLGRRHGATLYMTLLAAFEVLLNRYTGQDDLLLGSPTTGRGAAELSGVMGYFINPVVLRADLTGRPSFAEHLARARRTVLETFEHQELPFPLLAERLAPVRDASRSPIFQVFFVMEQARRLGERGLSGFALGDAGAAMELFGLPLESLPLERRSSQFDLMFLLAPVEGGLGLALEYNPDLFDATTPRRLLGHFRTLLESAVAEPGARVRGLPLLKAPERFQLLHAWNAGDRADEAERAGLHRLFEAQVARDPDAVAVVHGVAELTYRQLDEAAGRLARHLHGLGVGPETRVALCLERGLELVVGILGILKAGGAYVPLDPAYPRPRLAFILEDAFRGVEAPVVVSRQSLAAELPLPSGSRVVCLDDGLPPDPPRGGRSLGEEGAGAPPDRVLGAHPAYLIYTSGSTGRPKGVPVTHANVARLLLSAAEAGFDFGPRDVWTLFHSYAFDFSVWEIWGALAWGGRLVVVPREVSRSPEAFHELLATEGVTVLNQTPSAFRQLIPVREAEKHQELDLRWVIFGGEALEPASLRPWVALEGESGPRLVNMYGITETTVHVTRREVRAGDLAGTASRIGAPLPGLELHLAGPGLDLVPVGVPGEILVAGAGLARGYLGRGALTAERFVPNPFGARPGSRLYKSGDLARRRGDGEPEYLGRIDHQVQVRGFRIEPGEVEAVLREHPGAGAVAVTARDGRLVAHVVPAGDATGKSELRGFLAERLPEYMVPSAWVFHEALPQTASGKVDRLALAAMAPRETRPGEARERPPTASEEKLARVWCEVLGVERVAPDDDFFELGGHSLLAARLVSRAREVLGAEIPLGRVFEVPTLAGLAATLGEPGAETAVPPLVPLSRREGDVPLSFPQERLWFLDRLSPGNPAYNVPAAFSLRGPLDAAVLTASLGEIARRHEVLRASFPLRDGRPCLVVAPAGPHRLPLVDLRGLPDELGRRESRRRAAELVAGSFDLARGPLLRTALLATGRDEQVLALALHHAVCDGWSSGVFVRELSALYRAFAEGRRSPLPEPALRYSDFAVWQRRWRESEVANTELAWWCERLRGLPPVLELPTDRPRPAAQSFRGARRPYRLGEALRERLEAVGRRHGATLFMTLAAAWSVLLHRSTGQRDLALGTPVANRRHTAVEGLIGYFTNILVLRLDLGGRPTFDALLARVREAALGAFDHQELPFEVLVEALRPERDLSYNPLFQVLFGLDNAPREALDLPGLESRSLAVGTRAARFDLALDFEQGPAGLTGFFEYSTELFDATTVARMAAQLSHLLAAVGEGAEAPVSTLALTGAAQRRQLSAEWNDTATAGLAGRRCLQELVAVQARRRPEAVALVGGGEALSYRALGERAGGLALRLRRLGVGPEVAVGVCVEPCVAMVVGLLGVLESGGAYLPMDPTYPAERLAFLLEDSRVPVLLAQGAGHEALSAVLGDGPGAPPVVDLDDDGVFTAGAAFPGPAAAPDNLAYVIYTSGSTGRPKGVEIEHYRVSHLVESARAVFGFGPDDVWTVYHTFAFDVSVWEMWNPLAHGGRLVIVPRATARTPRLLLELLADERVTVFNQTPSALRLVEEGLGGDVTPRRVVVGGEALAPELAVRLTRIDAEVWNVYGPTESTVWTTAERVGDPHQRVSTLGRPLPDRETHLVDRTLRPVPVGVAGELLLGGVGLARGYFRRPRLTAEKFVPHPFARAAGERLYRSGDLCRLLAGGNPEFLGRVDHQVKVRGYRVELGEVESALGTCPGVAECVVVARGSSETELVAYLVPGAETPAVDALRRSLRERLPEYMVPSVFVFLESLPLNHNGKVDRRALPAPPQARPELARAAEAPRSATEAALAELWGELLGLDEVGVLDDFFDLGGHSLKAAELTARVAERFGVEVPLRALFEEPTVAGLARAVEASSPDAEALPAWVAAPQQRFEPFPLTEVQQAYWIGRGGEFALGGVSTHSYLEVEAEGLDLERLEAAWRRLVERHDMLRAVVLESGEQRVLPEVEPYRIEALDLRGRPRAEAERRLGEVREHLSHQVLPADRWPLFEIRASLLDGGRTRLHVSLDALIYDAWSAHLLLQEWSALYRDPDAELPRLEATFRDYVLTARRLEDSAAFRRALDYWRERARTLPPPPELPLARDPATLERPRFKRRALRLEASSWRELGRWARGLGITPSGLLLAAYAEVLALWSKSPRLTLNLTLFQRPPLHPQVDRLVGDFSSLTLLAVEAAGEEESFAERARRLQGRLWQDLDHRQVGALRVLREMARAGSAPPSGMPVVFTSTLGFADRLSAPSLPGEIVYSITQTPQVWLDQQVVEDEGALVVSWDAVEELFEPGLLDDLFAAYRSLLERLERDESAWEASAAALARELLPSSHLERVAQVNATSASVSEELLHTLFFTRAEQRPAAAAVVFPGGLLSYGELARRALGIGHRLRREGVRPGAVVAVAMARGWEQVAAVLGVLAAGAAYLPVDPELPAERAVYLLENGRVSVALTQSSLEERLARTPGLVVLAVDRDFTDRPAALLEPVQGPDELAYVIYTSGSTGHPKGVAISHRGAVNTVLDVNRRYGVGPGDRVLALSSLSFDLSVYDFFGLLAAGGAVVTPAPDGTRDPAHWAERADSERVTVWNSVPALAELWVEHLETHPELAAPRARLALLSGDWIPVTLPDRLRGRVPGLRVVSLGGATEASIWSILYEVGEVDPAWPSIPYGKPMDNQRFYVLDGRMAPRPPWVPGDLYIGGVGLALGYWRDEEKTLACFPTHPQSGERLYRTGDLGRYLPDGSIEFLGREDFQVKVRGHRVELGEVEGVLAGHRAVREAVVVVKGSGSGARLAACVVLREADADPAELRSFLAGKLPGYMVPAEVVVLGALPLTANGKVDRAALARAIPGRAVPDRAVPAPRDEEGEGRITALVAEVLELEPRDVRSETDLLELGATSLDMIRLANRLEAELGSRPAVQDFYRDPTVGALLRFYEARPETPAAAAGDAPRDAPSAAFEMILDPDERAAFKRSQPGLRSAAGEVEVALPEAGPDAFERLLRERRSHRHFRREAFPLERLSSLLGCLRQGRWEGGPKYLYPSAGGLYPVQTYIHVKPSRVEGLAAGTYHYRPVEHRLARLSPVAELDPAIHDPYVNRPIYQEAAFSLFLVAQLAAIAPIYGDQALDFSMLEAGYLSQLLMMHAPDCGLGLCPIGQMDFEAIRDLFDLEASHVLVHSHLGGAPETGRAPTPAPLEEPYAWRVTVIDDHEEGAL